MRSCVGGTRGGCEAASHRNAGCAATSLPFFSTRPTTSLSVSAQPASKSSCSAVSRCGCVEQAPVPFASSAAASSSHSSSSTLRAGVPHSARRAAALGPRPAQRRPSRLGAGGMDVMPAWTLDQIAGLVFGGVMLVSVTSSSQLDVFVARAQRRQLGLCEQCGGVNQPATCQQSNCPMKPAAGQQQQQQQQQQ